MKRIIHALVAIVLLVLAGIATLPFLIRGEFAAAQLAAAFKKASGRKLTLINAPYLTFWPELALEVEGASVSNPPGLFDGTTVSAQKLRIRLTWADVVSRRINVKDLTLIQPRLTLVVDKQGNTNWAPGQQVRQGQLTGGADQAISSKATASLQFAPVTIEDGEIVYSDERSGTSFTARNVNAVVSMASAGAPVEVNGTLNWNGQRVAVQLFAKAPGRLALQGSPIDLSIQSNNLKASFSGLAKLQDGLNLAGKASTQSPDLRKLAKWAGFDASGERGMKQFSTSASIDMTGKVIRLKDAFASLDGMNAQGSAKITLSGARPLIEAHLGLDRLNTNIYTGQAPVSPGSATGKAGDTWSDAAIDLGGLKSLDANLKLRTGSMIYANTAFGETLLDLVVSDGKLSATLQRAALYDGTASGWLSADGNAAKPAFIGTLDASGLNAQGLLNDFASISWFGGKLDMKLDLSAAGSSQAELVSTLKGTVDLALKDGLVRGIDLARMVNGVRSAILGGWDKTNNVGTAFDAISASFTLQDGIGSNDNFSLQGPIVRASGKGEVDLLRKKLTYRMVPEVTQLGNGQFAGPSVPVVISGTWANPRVYPDVKGILDDPQAAFDTLRKPGGTAGDVNVEAAGQQLPGVARKELRKTMSDEGARQVENPGGALLKEPAK